MANRSSTAAACRLRPRSGTPPCSTSIAGSCSGGSIRRTNRTRTSTRGCASSTLAWARTCGRVTSSGRRNRPGRSACCTRCTPLASKAPCQGSPGQEGKLAGMKRARRHTQALRRSPKCPRTAVLRGTSRGGHLGQSDKRHEFSSSTCEQSGVVAAQDQRLRDVAVAELAQEGVAAHGAEAGQSHHWADERGNRRVRGVHHPPINHVQALSLGRSPILSHVVAE